MLDVVRFLSRIPARKEVPIMVESLSSPAKPNQNRQPQSEQIIQRYGQQMYDLVDELIHKTVHDIEQHVPLHKMEKDAWKTVLALGRCLLQMIFEIVGSGDVGPRVTLPDGRTVKRLDDLSKRDYTCPFGEFHLERTVYGTRKGKKIEFVPLDERLGLPESKFSYLLQDWDQSEVMEQPFDRARGAMARILDLTQHVDSLEQMNRQMARQVEAFHGAQLPPEPESEGEILVQTADHKGVPLQHSADRTTAADHDAEAPRRENRKRMATLAGVYSIDPYIRTPDQVVEGLFAEPGSPRDPDLPPRPKPRNKRLRACLPHENHLGEQIDGTAAMFGWLADEVFARNPDGLKTLIHLTDGEECLRTMRDVFQEGVAMVDILDLLHATSRVWRASRLLGYTAEAEREKFVRERVSWILHGEVKSVIVSFRQLGTRRGLTGKRLKELHGICNYFEKNQERMRYDEYLAKGYPIASGVIEGACRNVVKDRMERTGMSWVIEGALAMLSLRCVWLSDSWEEYHSFRIERETQRLHPNRPWIKELPWALAT
jgi:hypothetical protein